MHRFSNACEGLQEHDKNSLFIDTNEIKFNQPSVAVTVFTLFPVITDIKPAFLLFLIIILTIIPLLKTDRQRPHAWICGELHQFPVREPFPALVPQDDVDHQSDTAHSDGRYQYGPPLCVPFVLLDIRVQT